MMITWELAKDRYKLSEFYLEMLAIRSNTSICDSKNRLVKDLWNPPNEKK